MQNNPLPSSQQNQSVAQIYPAIGQSLENRVWTQIPRANYKYLAICAVILLLDIPLLLSDLHTYGQYYGVMLISFAVFLAFALVELFFSKKFSTKSPHRVDAIYDDFAKSRNIVFVLNVIPLVQIVGLMADYLYMPIVAVVLVVSLIIRASKP